MGEFSTFLRQGTLNHFFRNSSQSAVAPYAGLYLLGTGTAFTVTAGSDLVNSTSHGKSAGDIVLFKADVGGVLPAGLSAGIKYYVVNPNANDFQVSLSYGGAVVDITGSGTGTFKYYAGLTPAGTGMTEVSAGNYARQAITFGAPSASGDAQQVASSADVQWTVASANYGEIGAVGIFSAVSAGSMMTWEAVVPRDLQITDIYKLASGNIVVSDS